MTAALQSTAAVAAAAGLGSLPIGWWIGRALAGEDLRDTGSGSTGATNVARRVGTWAGIATLLADAVKGAAAVALAAAWSPRPWGTTVAAVVVVVFHCWNPWLGFRGGRGVAPAAGAFLVLTPAPTAFAVGGFAAVFLLSRRVSAGSVAACAILPVAALLRGEPGTTILATLAVSAIILVRHRDNLARLRSGNEPALGTRRSPPEE